MKDKIIDIIIELSENEILRENLDIDLIICSPLLRAKHTCDIINANNVPVVYDKRLEERDCGIYEGRELGEFYYTDFWNYNSKLEVEGLESIQDLFKRVKLFLDEIKEKYKNKNILLVAHGGISKGVYYYFNDIQKLVNDFNRNQIPLSVLLLGDNWHLKDKANLDRFNSGFTFNRELFYKPSEFVDYLHERNIKLGLSLDPSEGIHPHEPKFEDIAKMVGINNKTIILNIDIIKSIQKYRIKRIRWITGKSLRKSGGIDTFIVPVQDPAQVQVPDHLQAVLRHLHHQPVKLKLLAWMNLVQI